MAKPGAVAILASTVFLGGCPAKTDGPAAAGASAREALPRIDAAAAAPPSAAIAKAPWRVAAEGTQMCLTGPGRSAVCGSPREERTDAGRAIALVLAPVAAVPPQTLPESAVKAVQKVVPGGGVASIDHAACGLGASGDVWCAPEARYYFNDEVEAPLAVKATRVPNLADAAEITLMPWLTLCVRRKSGTVACSPSPAASTEVCELRGKTDIRCGATGRGAVQPTLLGAGYDPRRVLDQPLAPVPGVSGATSLHAFRRLAYHMGESARRIFVGEFDEGGCAEVADGVRCWDRDPCVPTHPWRSAKVEGLPPALAKVRLSANQGYALTPDGALYRWPKHSVPVDCAKKAPLAFTASKVEGEGPVFDVAGGTFVVEAEPMTAGIDCASYASGSVACWRTDSAPERIDVRITP